LFNKIVFRFPGFDLTIIGLIDLKSTYFVSTIILLIPLLFFIIENKFMSAFKDSSGITLS